MGKEPITRRQYGYLVALYRQKGIFKTIPDTFEEASREIARLAPRKQQFKIGARAR